MFVDIVHGAHASYPYHGLYIYITECTLRGISAEHAVPCLQMVGLAMEYREFVEAALKRVSIARQQYKTEWMVAKKISSFETVYLAGSSSE